MDCNKHLMTGPKGNSESCFPETPNVDTEGQGETKLTVSRGASH